MGAIERGLDTVAAADPEATIQARSPRQLFWRNLRSDRVALTALVFLVGLAVVALLAPVLVSLLGLPGPDVQNQHALDSFGTPTGPTAKDWLGVDPLGRDVLSRIIYGSRVSLEVALIATALSTLIGATVGILGGFYRGWVDGILSRIIDVVLSFPILLLGVGLASACSLGNGCLGGTVKPGLFVVVLVIVAVNWTYMARIVRGQTLSLREREFVEAARSLGASDWRIITREILPNLATPILVYATLMIPANIVLEAALSFLGVGVQPPTPSWGQMIADASGTFDTAWWYMLFPGLALVGTVLAFNLLGDGLQDALNPRGRR